MNAGLTQAQTGIAKFGAVAQLAAVGAGAAILKFGADAVSAASDLNESMNKVTVVFEDQADEIKAWAKTSAESMGISEQAALESAGTFGNLFDAMGLAEKAGAEMSMTLVEMASDLASFNNQDPTDVLEALQSGLTGQIRPLRQFGIEISEAALKQEALSQGITKSVEEMTMAEKVQLRYALILKQTGNAQGDFARTSDELANSQRILRAEWEDLQADLGQLLLPTMVQFVDALGDLVRVLSFVATGFKDFNEEVKASAINVAEAELKAASWVESLAGRLPILGRFVDVIGTIREVNNANNAIWEATPPIVDLVSSAIHGAVDEFIQGDRAISDVDKAMEALTDAMRENRLATLALTDSFFGIQDSANQVEAAQRKLNQMQQAGKTDTKAYEQAIQDAILAQAGLEEAVFSYAQELADAGKKQSDVVNKVRALGAEFGLTKKDLDPLIARITDYINELNRIPSNVTTTLTTRHVSTGGTSGGLTKFQHGGIVTRPTIGLVGEAGPEAVIPLERAGALGGIQGDIVLNVDGRELARITRDELNRLAGRNATSGLRT